MQGDAIGEIAIGGIARRPQGSGGGRVVVAARTSEHRVAPVARRLAVERDPRRQRD